ncbi:Uncharacterised protein [Enterobacter cloacae]|nr:Uncharacterised protein [Enterobacter cloacae]
MAHKKKDNTMPSIECSNEECGIEFDVVLAQLDKESNGTSGNHTTSYTYTGEVKCPECECSQDVEYITDELDDTGEILTIERV